MITAEKTNWGCKSVGLGYFMIFITILGTGALSGILLKAAWKIRNYLKKRPLAVILFLLGVPCGVFAIYIAAIILMEGLYY